MTGRRPDSPVVAGRRAEVRAGCLALCLVLLGMAPAAPAQGLRDELSNHPPAQRAAALTQVMQETLSLSDEQARALLVINEKAAAQVDAAAAQFQRRDLRQHIRAINEVRDKELQAILQPDQYATWQVQKREIMKAAKERRNA